jgi:hypothetical protein
MRYRPLRFLVDISLVPALNRIGLALDKPNTASWIRSLLITVRNQENKAPGSHLGGYLKSPAVTAKLQRNTQNGRRPCWQFKTSFVERTNSRASNFLVRF